MCLWINPKTLLTYNILCVIYKCMKNNPILIHQAKWEKYHCQAKISHLEKQDKSKTAIYEEADLQDRALDKDTIFIQNKNQNFLFLFQ